MDRISDSNPKIVLTTPYYLPTIGGITTFVSGLKEELSRRGARVTVLTREGDDAPGVLRGPSKPREFVRWCRKTVRSIAPDVVHGHAHWYCLAGAFTWSGQPLARRVLFTVHTVPRVSRLYLPAFRRLLLRADLVTFVSENSKQVFVARFGRPRQSAVIFPGVRSFPDSSVSMTSAASGLRICAVSMMSWESKVEGLRVLLKATDQLSRNLPDVSLILVGDGEFRPELESLAQGLGINKRVRFAGLVHDPGKVISQSDVFSHISFMDSFPQAVVEALSLGVPVVVNEGALDDPIFRGTDSGIVRCSPTAQGLMEALQDLASSPAKRARLGEKGREFVSREFSWRRSGARFWDSYGLDSNAAQN